MKITPFTLEMLRYQRRVRKLIAEGYEMVPDPLRIAQTARSRDTIIAVEFIPGSNTIFVKTDRASEEHRRKMREIYPNASGNWMG